MVDLKYKIGDYVRISHPMPSVKRYENKIGRIIRVSPSTTYVYDVTFLNIKSSPLDYCPFREDEIEVVSEKEAIAWLI